ncbi:MAG: hypothetical protein KDJ65_21110 [Anaerolineae bacterium]|nr:hypothetical protein [Anaerolineae bacterium]
MNNIKTTLPELTGVKHRFVTIGDVRFHVAEPLVLLPSLWGRSRRRIH